MNNLIGEVTIPFGGLDGMFDREAGAAGPEILIQVFFTLLPRRGPAAGGPASQNSPIRRSGGRPAGSLAMTSGYAGFHRDMFADEGVR